MLKKDFLIEIGMEELPFVAQKILNLEGKDIFETQSEVNLAILERFNAEGLNFAFPTQTAQINS